MTSLKVNISSKFQTCVLSQGWLSAALCSNPNSFWSEIDFERCHVLVENKKNTKTTMFKQKIINEVVKKTLTDPDLRK